MRDGRIKRIGGLPGEHRAHGFNRSGDHGGNCVAALGSKFMDSQQPGFHVARILARFEQQDIGAAFHQPLRLQIVVVDQVWKRDAAGDGNGFRRRPHGTRDEAHTAIRKLGSGLAGKLRGGIIELV